MSTLQGSNSYPVVINYCNSLCVEVYISSTICLFLDVFLYYPYFYVYFYLKQIYSLFFTSKSNLPGKNIMLKDLASMKGINRGWFISIFQRLPEYLPIKRDSRRMERICDRLVWRTINDEMYTLRSACNYQIIMKEAPNKENTLYLPIKKVYLDQII